MQSELLPSACMVELPSNPQRGRSARVGDSSNAFICVLPRRLGTGCLPSSQMYSSLYLVMRTETASLRVSPHWPVNLSSGQVGPMKFRLWMMRDRYSNSFQENEI